MAEVLATILVILMFVIPLYLFFDLVHKGIEGEFILLKKCQKCNKYMFRWKVAEKEHVGFSSYLYKCKKCKKKEEIKEQREQDKRREYEREDDLIDEQLYPNDRMGRKLRRDLYNLR